jgi:CHAD domain-containing protein
MNEAEAKFIIRRPEQIDRALRVLEANGFSISPQGTAEHADRYFDTADWSILVDGWACRVRRRHGREKVTLKSLDSSSAAVLVRAEISQHRQGDEVNAPLSLPGGAVREKLESLIGDKPTLELFQVSSRRTVYQLEKPGAQPVRIEFDIDESRIDADRRTEKATGVLEFTELEAELQSGNEADLESVAALLRDEAGLTPAQFSKFERGLQAAGLEMVSLRDTPDVPDICADDPILSLLYHYLARQSGIVLREHPRALEGIDPEGVHQMRVSTRRLRVVMKAFRNMLGDEAVTRFNAELRWLARNLGRARDADVIEQGARNSGDSGAEHYLRFLGQEKISAYEHLADILQSERCAELETELQAFVAAGPARRMQEQFGTLSAAAPAQEFIYAALNKLLAHGDAIDADVPARQLHKLRIEVKRFRYLLDFFSTVQTDEWLPLTEAVKKLQDVLGEHQDAVTAQARLADYTASLSDDHDRENLVAVAGLMQGEIDRIAACRQDFATTWADFRALAG